MFENRKVIVTLTTIPSRLKYLLSTLLSLLNQSVKADEIVLSLPKSSVREPSEGDPYKMDLMLTEFIKKSNITVLRCEKDYGPATKLLGVLKREKNLNLNEDEESLIITVDDDKIYDKNTIEYLLNGWKRNKYSVLTRKGSIITRTNKNNKSYINNKVTLDTKHRLQETIIVGTKIKKDTKISILFGTSGVLYRASYFNNDVFNYKKYNPNFPEVEIFTSDDIFFSGYLGKNTVPIKVIKIPETKYTLTLHPDERSTSIDSDTLNRKINPLININLRSKDNSVVSIEYFKDVLLFAL